MTATDTRFCGDPIVVEAAGVVPPDPGFLPRECCDSCHDDINDLGAEYYIGVQPKGSNEWWLLCCRIAERVRS